MNRENPDSPSTGSRLGQLSGLALRLVGFALVAYLAAVAAYGIYNYQGTRAKLLTYGITDATASLLASAALLVALAVPAISIFRIAVGRGRPKDFALAMVVPVLAWLPSQIPANFDARSGVVLRYCAERPDSTLFCLDHPGIDPITQKELAPISSDVAEREYRKRQGLVPKRIAVENATIEFFDPLSGKARVFFARNDSGCFDLFDNEGFHPETQERLQPATREFVRKFKECSRSAQPANFVAEVENTDCVPHDIYFNGELVVAVPARSIQQIRVPSGPMRVRNCISNTSRCTAERSIQWGPSAPSLLIPESADCVTQSSRPAAVALTVYNQHCRSQDLYVGNDLIGTIPAQRKRFFELVAGQYGVRSCLSGTVSCAEPTMVTWEPGTQSFTISTDRRLCAD